MGERTAQQQEFQPTHMIHRINFTPAQIAAIRKRRAEGATIAEISAECGVSKTYVSEISLSAVPRKRGYRADGLIHRVQGFFEANHDEELSHADVRLKFGAGKRNAENAVARLVRDGVIESVHVIRRRRSNGGAGP